MLYTLYLGFVGLFVAIAAIGHVLLLRALYPNIRGYPGGATDSASGLGERSSAGPAAQPATAQHEPRLAA